MNGVPVAVTGAGGYLGGRLVEHLAGLGADVAAVVRTPRPWLDEIAGVRQVRLTATTEEGWASAIEGAQRVFHLAGPNEVAAGLDPAGSTAEAVAMAYDVARACDRVGVQRVVCLSTVHVYGPRATSGSVDEATLPEPRHPYAVARLACEHAMRGVVESTVVVRLTNMVGPPLDPRVDRWTLVANDLCRQAVQAGVLEIRSPNQWRDFVPMTTVLGALAGAAEPTQLAPGVFNLGSGQACTIGELAEIVASASERVTGRPVSISTPPSPDAAGARPFVDCSKLAGALALPAGSLEDEVMRTVEHCARWEQVGRG